MGGRRLGLALLLVISAGAAIAIGRGGSSTVSADRSPEIRGVDAHKSKLLITHPTHSGALLVDTAKTRPEAST